VSVLEDPSHLFQCDIECVGWGVFLRRGRVSVATPPAAFEIRGGRTDGHHGHAVGGGSAVAGWSHAPRYGKPAADDRADSVGVAGAGLGTFVWFDICSTSPAPAGAVLSAVGAGAVDCGGSARGVSADAHAGHSQGASQLVFAAESACVCSLGLRLWALVIGAPFLLWWRPFWQSVLIVSWGWIWATMSYIYTDSAPVSGAFTCRSTPRLYSSTPRW